MSYPADLTDEQWAVLDALFAERATAKRYLTNVASSMYQSMLH